MKKKKKMVRIVNGEEKEKRNREIKKNNCFWFSFLCVRSLIFWLWFTFSRECHIHVLAHAAYLPTVSWVPNRIRVVILQPISNCDAHRHRSIKRSEFSISSSSRCHANFYKFFAPWKISSRSICRRGTWMNSINEKLKTALNSIEWNKNFAIQLITLLLSWWWWAIISRGEVILPHHISHDCICASWVMNESDDCFTKHNRAKKARGIQ